MEPTQGARRVRISSLDGLPTDELVSRPNDFDAVVASVGYEERARFVSSQLLGKIGRGWAATFETHQLLSFDENLAWFREADFEVTDANAETYRKQLREFVNGLVANTVAGSVRIAVDISSMTRRRIAETIRALAESDSPVVHAEWFYAPAKYSPHAGEEGPIVERAPLPGFEGWSIDPGLPTTLVLGLGYERYTAVGVAEMLEPVRIWAYRPKGIDARYDRDVAEANSQLLPLLSNGQFIDYEVMRPYASFSHLEHMVHGLLGSSRPVVVPLGPKIFALNALLTAWTHGDSTSVWRVSADYKRIPVERKPVGNMCAISTTFEY